VSKSIICLINHQVTKDCAIGCT